MAIHNTPNLNIPYPDGNELVSGGPTDFQTIAQALDAGTSGPTVIRVQLGALAGRPAASTVPLGTMYHCTDAPCYFIRDGQPAWRYVPLDGNAQPIGSLTQYAGASDPADPDGVVRWVVCDGRALGRTAYAGLFGAIGATYGPGDGSTTFNIPDLRGTVPVGAGQGSGLTNRVRGAGGGEESHLLGTAEMPAHGHGVNDPGHSHTGAAGQEFIMWNPGASDYQLVAAGTGATTTARVVSTGGAATGITIQAAGGGGSHNNMQPYVVVNHIIKVL